MRKILEENMSHDICAVCQVAMKHCHTPENPTQFNLFCSRNPYLAIQTPDNVEEVTNPVSKYVRERGRERESEYE
jgi:hypothetical protein